VYLATIGKSEHGISKATRMKIWFLSVIWPRRYAGNFLNNLYKNPIGGVGGNILN